MNAPKGAISEGIFLVQYIQPHVEAVKCLRIVSRKVRQCHQLLLHGWASNFKYQTEAISHELKRGFGRGIKGESRVLNI